MTCPDTWRSLNKMTTNSASTRPATYCPRLSIICVGALVLCTVGYQPVHAADKTSSRSLLEQAKQFEQAHQYGDAIAIYRTILQQDLENDDVRAALARVLLWQGSHTEAAELYREIVHRHPADLDVRTALARVLSWQTDRKEAQQLYEGVLRENPRHAEALQGLGDLLFWEERATDALPYYERAYAIGHDYAIAERIASIKRAHSPLENPPPPTAVGSTTQERAERLAQAQAWEQTGQTRQAITAYQQILTDSPADDETRGNLARVLARDGQFDQATSLYRDILTRHPSDLDVQTGLARVLSWNKHYDSAIQQYQSVLQQNSTHREALQGLADTLFWSGATQEAAQRYAHLYQLTGDEAVAARMRDITALLEASPQAPLGLRDATIRLPFRDYLKVGYGQFSYSRGIRSERDVLLEVSKSIGAQTLIARVEPINRFGFHDTVLSAEGYSPLWRRAWGYLAAQGTINPDFSPKYSFAGEVSQGLGLVHPLLTMFEASFGYRYLSYKTDDIHLLSPGLTVFLPLNLWLTEKLYYVPETGAITLSSRLTWRPTNRLQVFVSGSFGTSGERIVATQDVTRVSSRTIQGGIVFPLADRVSLEVTGYDEDRGALYTRRGASFSIIYHW
ncbi:MAG: tetratricopeptide repeat protein [Nitrospira sp.]|nr:tetratricopeptide repeat protein [Nitrospira sp.]